MKYTLSPRQVQIMRMICRGFVAKEIATQKGMSFFTVKMHLRLIKRRLNARNTTQAAVIFSTSGHYPKG